MVMTTSRPGSEYHIKYWSLGEHVLTPGEEFTCWPESWPFSDALPDLCVSSATYVNYFYVYRMMSHTGRLHTCLSCRNRNLLCHSLLDLRSTIELPTEPCDISLKRVVDFCWSALIPGHEGSFLYSLCFLDQRCKVMLLNWICDQRFDKCLTFPIIKDLLLPVSQCWQLATQ